MQGAAETRGQAGKGAGGPRAKETALLTSAGTQAWRSATSDGSIILILLRVTWRGYGGKGGVGPGKAGGGQHMQAGLHGLHSATSACMPRAASPV